jgi:2-polyprenyl-3-methyl-5-hydroxy-6-metoxy-1,4-benzoquinol methylase
MITPRICKICGNDSNNRLHLVKEMQLGTRELFTYLECGHCGCMQLLDIPSDMGKYYPKKGYYSFNLSLDVRKKSDPLRKLKASYLLYGRHKILGSILSIGYKKPEYYSWIKNAGVRFEDAILDVGAGNGSLLLDLFKIGFTHLNGIDPFIDQDHHYGSVTVLKKNIFETTGQYDFIMLHHAFEHMDEPLAVLQQLFKLLKKGKCLLIRTPVMGMYGWKKYGLHWMDLDAPRHVFVHSLKSMQLLTAQAGFELRKTVFDGNYMSLIGSDQYAKDIALPDDGSYMVNRSASGYSKRDIRKFKALNRLNDMQQQSDQAAFYLFKP